MNSRTTKKVTLALGVASVAASVGNAAVKAGPALQTLNNVTNSAEFTINNTYGQSFSVDGIVQSGTANIVPFAAGGATTMVNNFQAGQATLSTGFSGQLSNFSAVSTVSSIASASAITVPTTLNAAGLAAITLTGGTGTQTIGASISSTIFGTSNVKASTSFTNQLINDLSAF